MVRAADAIDSRASLSGKRSRLRPKAMTLVPRLSRVSTVAPIGCPAGSCDEPIRSRAGRATRLTLVPCSACNQRRQSVENYGFEQEKLSWYWGFRGQDRFPLCATRPFAATLTSGASRSSSNADPLQSEIGKDVV